MSVLTPSLTLKKPLNRRTTIAGLVASLLAPAISWAQSDKTVKFILPLSAGSGVDGIARAASNAIGKALGQTVVIENQPGAGGVVGTATMIKSAPDGLTLSMVSNNHVIFPSVLKSLPFDPLADITPIAVIGATPMVLVVNAKLPVKNLDEFTALLKANPGKYNFASVGNGSSSHLTMEYLKALTGTYAVHIPFNGGPPAALSTASGDTQILATVPTLIRPQVQAGRMKALAVTGKTRYALTPELPTLAESGVKELANFEAIAWNGVLVAAGTPRATIDRINAAVNAAMKDPATIARLKTAGLDTVGGTPEEFAKLIADDNVKWGPIIKRSGAQLD